MNPLSDVLTRSATTAADRPAVSLGERVLTYAELDGASRNVAGILAAKGVVAGDRVGIMLPNVPEFAAIYFGVLRAGATVVPMNPLLKTREVEYYLRDSGARAILAWGDIAGEAVEGAERAGVEHVEVDGALLAGLDPVAPNVPAAERADGDTAVILYTSGTTGTPKGPNCRTAAWSRTSSSSAANCSGSRPPMSSSAHCRCFTRSARRAP